jgi:hypothetical protein
MPNKSTIGGSRGPGLDDVIKQALERWRPQDSARKYRFGAAGRRGFAIDFKIDSLVTRGRAGTDPEALFAEAPMRRLFNTDVGRRTAKAVRNETRTLTAIERLSLEIMAESLRVTGQVHKDDRLLTISQQEDRPAILMLMSRKVRSVEDSRVVSDEMDLPLEILEKGLSELSDTSRDTPEAAALREVQRGGEVALAQVFAIARPEIVRTRQPRMIALCVPSPHIRVEARGKVSTAGVFCHDAEETLGVTACYHGTGPEGTEVTVGNRKCRIKRDCEVQDIVFIPLGEGFAMPQLVGRLGVLEDREPARSDRVHFDGATNQNKATRIFGADAGILRARPTIMLKLQTDPDTDQGDSGCALLDDRDRVLGFAFERTAYDDHPQFTDWIWAANALRALKVTPYQQGARPWDGSIRC